MRSDRQARRPVPHETGDDRVRQRGARAGAAAAGETQGVPLHDRGNPYAAARHGGGRGRVARRGHGGGGVRAAGGFGKGVPGRGGGAGGGGVDDAQSIDGRAGDGAHSGGTRAAHARGDGEQGADRARLCRATRRGGAAGGRLALRIERDGWSAGVQPVAAHDARGDGVGVHGGAEFDVERGDRDDGAGRELRCGPGGGAEDGNHGGRWGVRRGGLGLGGENGGAGQRADGRADHAATGDDARDYAADAGARDGDRARRQDGAAGEPGTANKRWRLAPRARRGAGAERHSGVHAGDQQPDSVPYGFDGYVRNGLDRAWGGTDGVWRIQRLGELAPRRLDLGPRWSSPD